MERLEVRFRINCVVGIRNVSTQAQSVNKYIYMYMGKLWPLGEIEYSSFRWSGQDDLASTNKK